MSSPKDQIITLPHKDLRKRSKKIGVVTDDILAIIEAMKAATLDWEDSREHEVGVALAAVQIDELYRIVVIRSNFDDKDDRTFQVFINPSIVKYDGEIVEDYEGCLSIKDIYGRVPRHSKVKITALDEAGKPFRLTAEGFLARVFQHEIDHTHGKLFIDHIKTNREAFYRLNSEGKLEALNYDVDIKDNHLLW